MTDTIGTVYERIASTAIAVNAARKRADEALTLCRRKVSSFQTLHGRFAALATAYDTLLPQITTAYGHDSVDDAWSVANDGRDKVWHGAGLTARDAVTNACRAARQTMAWCERGMNAFGDGSGLFLRPVASWLAELEAEVAKRRAVDVRAGQVSAGVAALRELSSWVDATRREAERHRSEVRLCVESVEKAMGNVPATITSLGTNVTWVTDEFIQLSRACDQAANHTSRVVIL